MNSSIEIKEEHKGIVLILHLEGRLDALSTPDIEKKIFQYVENGSKKLLLDFSGVDYISSAGMRLLLAIIKKLKPYSGQMAIYGVTTNVMDVLRMSGFDNVLHIFKTEEEALNFTTSPKDK